MFSSATAAAGPIGLWSVGIHSSCPNSRDSLSPETLWVALICFFSSVFSWHFVIVVVLYLVKSVLGSCWDDLPVRR